MTLKWEPQLGFFIFSIKHDHFWQINSANTGVGIKNSKKFCLRFSILKYNFFTQRKQYTCIQTFCNHYFGHKGPLRWNWTFVNDHNIVSIQTKYRWECEIATNCEGTCS